MNAIEKKAYHESAIYAGIPSLWAKDVLDFQADKKQKELLDSNALDSLIVWSRQTGKTETASATVSHFALHVDETLTVLTSATQRQAGIITGRIQADLRKATGEAKEWQRGKEYEIEEMDIFGNVRIVRISVMSMSLSNGSNIVAIPPSPDSARGYAHNLVVIDEAARTKDALWHAISPMRAARRVRLIAMTTASAMEGWFYDLWMNDPDVWRSEYLAAQCPRINKDFLLKEQRRLPDFIYRAEYENKWFPQAGAALDPETIRDMFSDSIEPMFDSPVVGESKRSFLSDEVEPI